MVSSEEVVFTDAQIKRPQQAPLCNDSLSIAEPLRSGFNGEPPKPQKWWRALKTGSPDRGGHATSDGSADDPKQDAPLLRKGLRSDLMRDSVISMFSDGQRVSMSSSMELQSDEDTYSAHNDQAAGGQGTAAPGALPALGPAKKSTYYRPSAQYKDQLLRRRLRLQQQHETQWDREKEWLAVQAQQLQADQWELVQQLPEQEPQPLWSDESDTSARPSCTSSYQLNEEEEEAEAAARAAAAAKDATSAEEATSAAGPRPNVRYFTDPPPARLLPKLWWEAVGLFSLLGYTALPLHCAIVFVAAVTYSWPAVLVGLLTLATLLLPPKPLMWGPFLGSALLRSVRTYFDFSFLLENPAVLRQRAIWAECPHGVFPMSMMLSVTLDPARWRGLRIHSVCASVLFRVPVWRHFLGWLGMSHATRQEFTRLLTEYGAVKVNPGACVCVWKGWLGLVWFGLVWFGGGGALEA